MNLITKFFQLVIKTFFDIYFSIFGKPKFGRVGTKVVSLYKNKNFSALFSVIRMWDAPFEEIDKVIPKNAAITDLGSGDGILANYLGVSSEKRKIIGVELDKDRFGEADKKVKNVKFKNTSILNFTYPKSDVFLISHVLHHLPSYKDQEKVIDKCLNGLKKGGKLVIVEIAEKPFLKYIFTWLIDTIAVPILFEKSLANFKIFYRSQNDWEKLIISKGFQCTSRLVHKGRPFSHLLIVAKKDITKHKTTK